MNQTIRQQVYDKYGGKCAYCGCELQKGWNVDHLEPVYRGWPDYSLEKYKLKRGDETIGNYMPSCPRCNKWKSTWTVEQFREQIQLQLQRLNAYNPNYRLAKDFGLVNENAVPVKFYFENQQQ